MENRFYNKNGFIILMILIFPIVGIPLMWKYKKTWNILLKCIISFISIIFIILFFKNFNSTETKPISKEVSSTKSTIESEADDITKSSNISTKPVTTATTTTTPFVTQKITSTKPVIITTTTKPPSSAINLVLNTSTKKYHKPNCRDVPRILPENRQDITVYNLSEVGSEYSPCGHCF